VALGLAALVPLAVAVLPAARPGPGAAAATASVANPRASSPDAQRDASADVSGGSSESAEGRESGTDTTRDASREAAAVGAPVRAIGPFQVPFLPSRAAFVVLGGTAGKPHRLIAGLHGVCTPPSYSCGTWLHAASEAGMLVCPTGNAECPDVPGAPTWEEPFAKIDEDLEASIAKVSARYPGELTREGAILTGYSRGAYAAVSIAARHPGRWPMLVLNEADVELTIAMLHWSKVRAVALIAGEWGAQIAGERKNVDDLAGQGFPIRLWVMPRAGHAYSANIEDIMREAIAFVLSHEHDG
jgi:hypothetical protein